MSVRCCFRCRGLSLQVQSQIAVGSKDIVKPEWLIACLEEERLVDKEPKYLVFMSESTRQAMKNVVDAYGDHYTRPTHAAELRDVFDKVSSST